MAVEARHRLGDRRPSTAPSTLEAVVLGGTNYKTVFKWVEVAFRRMEMGQAVLRRPRRCLGGRGDVFVNFFILLIYYYFVRIIVLTR